MRFAAHLSSLQNKFILFKLILPIMKDHILKTVKPHAKDFNAADTVNEIYDWVANTLAPQQCRQPSGSSQLVTNCNASSRVSRALCRDET